MSNNVKERVSNTPARIHNTHEYRYIISTGVIPLVMIDFSVTFGLDNSSYPWSIRPTKILMVSDKHIDVAASETSLI